MAVSRHLEFQRTRNSAVRSAICKTPSIEPNSKWIQMKRCSYCHLKFSVMCEWALRSVVGWSVVNIHTSYTDVIILLFHYVRNVAREE